MGKVNSARRTRTKRQKAQNGEALRDYARKLGEAIGAWPASNEAFIAHARAADEITLARGEYVSMRSWDGRCFMEGRQICFRAVPGSPPDWLFDLVIQKMGLDKLDPQAVFIAAYGLARMSV